VPSNLDIVRGINVFVENADGFPALRDELVAARDDLSRPARESPIGRQLARVVDEDVVIDMREIEVGWLIGKEVFRGLDEWIRMWATWFESWESFEITRQGWEELEGGEVLQDIAVDLGGRSSGATIPYHHFHLWHLRDAKVTRMSAHPTRDAALAAIRAAAS
jgi:hypothetical protein